MPPFSPRESRPRPLGLGQALRIQELGFRIGFIFRVYSLELKKWLEFRVKGLGFRVEGLRFRVKGLGFRDLRVKSLGFKVKGVEV